MTGGVNLSTYYRVAQLKQTLTSYIREATITKSQINASLISPVSTSSLAKFTGIGKLVDVLA